jgi:hypothetical protein
MEIGASTRLGLGWRQMPRASVKRFVSSVGDWQDLDDVEFRRNATDHRNFGFTRTRRAPILYHGGRNDKRPEGGSCNSWRCRPRRIRYH